MNVSKFTSVAVSTEACLINNRHNSTIITNLYEGIPETLILNLIAWIFFIALFTILRQQAWDYGRLALVNNHGENKRWTQLFYAHGNEDTQESTERNINQNQMIDRGFFSWIWVTIKLKKEQLLTHSGPDSVHYLSFQQHLMLVMGVITFISIVVILPVNFQGELSGDVNSFGHTTVSNLSPDSPWLWIHVIVAICYVPLVVLVMRKSSGRYAGKKASTRTIMATNIERKDCEKRAIRTYIQQLFPDIQLTDIQLAYNISKLISVAADYEKIFDARIFCEFHKNHNPVQVTTNCLKCETIDALEYYQEKERQLHGDVSRLKASALNEPLGIAFITVASTQEANNIIVHFRPGSYRRDGYRDWNLSFAPAPSDLFWENLSADTGRWYIKWFIVNLFLFLFLFFLTTPVIIVNLLDTLKITESKDKEISKISVLISEFLPTLLLLTLACVMPVIVGFSDKWLAHWTRSRQNYAIMTKSFGYLLFMILILPSLGLTSAQAFLEWTLQYNHENETFRWECIFLPDKGAFFVNYVITAAFIGTALELIRFPELIMYTWQLCRAKSRAETPHIRKSILIEFPFGIHYAWTIMVFTMSTVYSLLCPLIMPFAMVYIGLKHFGDRHNLYFAYGPSNMISQGGGKIHSAAVTMTKISVILLLIIMAALATLRGGGIDARAIVLIITLIVTLVLFTFMSPIKKCTTKPPSIAEPEGQSPLYIADVLLNKRIVPDSPTHLGYGSDSTVDVTISESELPIHVPT